MPIIKVNGYSDSFTPVGVSALGTVVFDNVVFPAGSWVDDDGNTQDYNKVKLDAVTLSVNRMKIVQKSRVSGRKGAIREYIALDDYTIDLQAIIAPETFSLLDFAQIGAANVIPAAQAAAGVAGFTVPDEPTELMNNIALLCNVQDRVRIDSKMLGNYFDITHVVIMEFSVTKSSADTYTLKMRMESDEKTDLKDFG